MRLEAGCGGQTVVAAFVCIKTKSLVDFVYGLNCRQNGKIPGGGGVLCIPRRSWGGPLSNNPSSSCWSGLGAYPLGAAYESQSGMDVDIESP